MQLKVIITGATGMVGEGVLQECLQNTAVEKVLLVNRKPSGVSHPKVEEIIHGDFNDITAIADRLKGYNSCFFCAGVSSVGMKEEKYTAVTYTLTIHFAEQLAAINPDMTFCYVSGAGTDSSGKGRLMWARVKGRTENDLMRLSFKGVYNFRPAFMKSFKGAKNTPGIYAILMPFYPFFRWLMPKYFITLSELGKAMISVSQKGYDKKVLEVPDIVNLAAN